MTRSIAYILLVMVLAYKLFYLVPWALVEGSFNVRDVSLVLIWGGVGWLLFSGARIEPLRHPLSLLLIAYLFLVLIHISLARLNYDQSLLNGIIAARTQFIYVAFFLYVLLLDTPEAIAKLLDYLSVIAVVVLLLSVVNYFFPVVFHSWRSEEWVIERSGIRRVFMPGTPLMNLATIWMMCRWVDADRDRWKFGLMVLLLVAGHFFHQSRGQIFGLLAAFLVIVVLKRRYAEFLYTLLLGLLAGLVLALTMPQNILLTPFTTAVEDVSEGTGTVKGRLVQLETDIEEFMQHPWIGSGLIAIRSSEYGGFGVDAREIALKTRKADLGYSHWVKMYGLAGIVWLGIVMYLIGSRSYRLFRRSSGLQNTLALFSFAFFSFVAITGVTLNHFLVPERIIVFTLLAAVVVRIEKFRVVEPEFASAPTIEDATATQSQASSRLLRTRQRNVHR